MRNLIQISPELIDDLKRLHFLDDGTLALNEIREIMRSELNSFLDDHLEAVVKTAREQKKTIQINLDFIEKEHV